MTYTPGLNGGRINANITGNTVAAGTVISTGTVVLAGGNNITLSQAGNTITISGGAGGGGGIAAYDGANSITSGTMRFSNSNGVSFGINGSTLTASHNGITSQTIQTQNMVSLLGSTGNISFANANGVTFGGNNSTLTASVAAQSNQTMNVYASSQTVGQSSSSSHDARSLSLVGRGGVSVGWTNGSLQISSPTQTTQPGIQSIQVSNTTYTTGNVIFSNANGLSFGSSAGGAVTGSYTVPTQSNQTLGLYGVSNTTQSSSATVDARSLTFAGAGIASVGASNGSLVISVPPGGGGGDGYNSAQFTNSTANSTMPVVWAGNSNGSGNITMGLTGSTVTASAPSGGGGGAKTGRYFDNMFQQNSVQGITFTSVSTGMYGRVIVQPLAPGNELFPYDITASTMRLNFSNSGTSSVSGAFSSSFYIGIYTRANSTQLSLLNSASTSYGLAAATNNSASFLGARWLSFNSTQFSAQPAFSEGIRYFFALLARTSSNSYASHSMAGMHLGASVQRSGYMATAASSNTSFNAWHPFMGVHSLTTHTGLPTNIANSEINKASVYANFIPQVIFDAGLGQMN